jgi:ATP-dependent helicase HrpB
VCYRLWSESVDDTLAAHSPPEILEADLTPLALELAAWGCNDPHSLKWLDPPPDAQARDLLRSPKRSDERDRHGLGRRMARPPCTRGCTHDRAVGSARSRAVA